MDKKEARKILGVTKETSRNEIERKYSIILKKKRLADAQRAYAYGDEQDSEGARDIEDMHSAAEEHSAVAVKIAAEQRQDTGEKQEEYTFEQVTQAYNILMGYEVTIKEAPPSKAAPLLKKAGIDEKKARNFLYYYKFHILGAIALILIIALSVRSCINRVDPDFMTAFIGEIGYTETDKLKAAIKAEIPEILEPGFDGAFISDNSDAEQQYAMVMKAAVLFAANEVDVFILDKDNFYRYAKQGAFMNLDDIAHELGVDMEENKDYILSVENNYDDSANDSGNAVAEKHLYGIDVSGSTMLKESEILGNEFIAAIYVNSKQQDKAVKLIRSLMK